jgi:hypothetical protein
MPVDFVCPHCGQQTWVDDKYIGETGPCAGCGNMVTVSPAKLAAARPLGEDAAMRMLLPVGRSPWAILAGYAGLVSVLLIFAPFALLFGILAVRDINRHPEKHGMGRAIFGIVMGVVFTPLLFLMIFSLVMAAHR